MPESGQARRLEAQQQGGRIVIGLRPEVRRLKELQGKSSKSQAEVQEEILLRLRRIEEHLGID